MIAKKSKTIIYNNALHCQTKNCDFLNKVQYIFKNRTKHARPDCQA